jgi:hypothetical protein
MKCGHLQVIRIISNGSGRRLMRIQKKSSDAVSEKETRKEPEDFGNHFRRYIVSAPSAAQIFGQHVRKYFLQRGIALFRNRAEKQVILRGSITL